MSFETTVTRSPIRLPLRWRVRRWFSRTWLRLRHPEVATAVEEHQRDVSRALWGERC